MYKSLRRWYKSLMRIVLLGACVSLGGTASKVKAAFPGSNLRLTRVTYGSTPSSHSFGRPFTRNACFGLLLRTASFGCPSLLRNLHSLRFGSRLAFHLRPASLVPEPPASHRPIPEQSTQDPPIPQPPNQIHSPVSTFPEQPDPQQPIDSHPIRSLFLRSPKLFF